MEKFEYRNIKRLRIQNNSWKRKSKSAT